MVFRGWPALFLPPLPDYDSSANEDGSLSVINKHSKIPSLVIGACNRSSLCRIQILVTLFPCEGPATLGIIKPARSLPEIYDIHGTRDGYVAPLQVS